MKKLFLIFLLSIPSLAYGEQEDATPLKTRSIRFINTFGLFYGDYDRIVIPRELSILERNRIITNLTNLNGENTFQLGFSKRIGFEGNLALSFSHSYFSEEKLLTQWTRNFRDERYDDGINDTMELIQETLAVKPYQEKRYTEVYAGYGHRISESLYFGGGLAYTRDSEDREYDLPEIGGTSKGVYGFGTSNLRERVKEVYDLMKDPPFLFYRMHEREDGEAHHLLESFHIFGGITYIFSDRFSISPNILLGYANSSIDGEGIYRSRKYLSDDHEVYSEGYTSSTSITSSGISFGTAVKFGLKSGTHQTILDIGYYRLPGEISDGDIKESWSLYQEIMVTGSVKRIEEVNGDWKGGRLNSKSRFVISLRDVYDGWSKIKVGYGIEYVRDKETYQKGNIQYSYNLSEIYDDGDEEVADHDDYEKTASAKMGAKIVDTLLIQEVGFPIAVILDLGGGFEIVAGVKHIIRKTETKNGSLISGEVNQYSQKTVYGDGRVVYSNELPPELKGKWIDRNGTVSESIEQGQRTESITRLRFGLSMNRFENISLEFMIDTGTGDGMHSALDLTKFYLSGLFRF
jgi:hypothetical protein